MKKCLWILIVLLIVGSASADVKFTDEQRPAVLVEETKNSFVVDGVQWGFEDNGEKYVPYYSRISIDPSKVKEVYYWSESFPPEWLAAHGMLAFIMEDMDGIVAEDGSKDIGIVLSVEARLKEGQSYSLFEGMKKNGFHIVYQLVSYTGRIHKSVALRNHPLDQFKLNLTKDQKVDLLKNTIKDTVINRDNEMYHTLNNSCVSNACRLINTVLPKKKRLKLWLWKNRIPNLRVSYPKFTYGYLCSKKVADKKSQTKLSYDMGKISFELDDGGNYVIDIQSMPGVKRIRGVEDELPRLMASYLDISQDLQTFSNVEVNSSEEFYAEFQEQIADLKEMEEEKRSLLSDAIEADFENNLSTYLSFDSNPELTGELDKELLHIVNIMTMNNGSEFLTEAYYRLNKRLESGT